MEFLLVESSAPPLFVRLFLWSRFVVSGIWNLRGVGQFSKYDHWLYLAVLHVERAENC